jgi:hypothetical protein
MRASHVLPNNGWQNTGEMLIVLTTDLCNVRSDVKTVGFKKQDSFAKLSVNASTSETAPLSTNFGKAQAHR